MNSDSFVLACMPIRKSARTESFFENVLRGAFEPSVPVKRIENIPHDWVHELRGNLRQSLLVCFDLSEIDGEVNHNTLRELTYVNTQLLDWEGEHRLPPICLYCDRPGRSNLQWEMAADIDIRLCGSIDGVKNNLCLHRSIAVLDYTNPLAVNQFRRRLADLRHFVTSGSLPSDYNVVLFPGQPQHPVIDRALGRNAGSAILHAVGFPPFYLRDEEYEGFQLACTDVRAFRGGTEAFWDAARRVLPFSLILKRTLLGWIEDPPEKMGDVGVGCLLDGMLAVTRSGMRLDDDLVRPLAALETSFVRGRRASLIREILSVRVVPPSRTRENGPQTGFQELRSGRGAIERPTSELYEIRFGGELVEALGRESERLWPSIFGPSGTSVHAHFLGLRTSGEQRYFSLTGSLSNLGIFEDSLDRIGPAIREIAIRLRDAEYSNTQIEMGLRCGIVVRLLLTWFRLSGQNNGDLNVNQMQAARFPVDVNRNLMQLIWNEEGLHPFEFQATSINKRNHAVIPWGALSEKVMRYLGSEAATALELEFDVAYSVYANGMDFEDELGGQIWGMLVACNIWKFCTARQFRDWWARYAVCEYINRERPEDLIVDIERIDRWAPVEYA